METPETPQPRVSRISIGRLYNLGRYEHKRYEISLDIPEGADAAAAMHRLQSILWDLRPVKVDDYTLSRSKRLIAKADAGEELAEHEKEDLENSRAYVEKIEAGKQRIVQAVAALNSFGGTSEYKDHKEDWDQDDY
jgi:Fe-S cluster assembly scaffold protein SufB